MRTPKTMAELRALVAAWPPATRSPEKRCPTGVAAIDEALHGGLPTGKLTELVSSVAGSGGQLVLTQLLVTTRAAGRRVALIDGADGFAPEAVPVDALRHLVWVRARSFDETLAAADILVRDGNYAVVVIDLRGLAERVIRRAPNTAWHRLHRAAERRPGAVLIQSTFSVVPAVGWRLVLPETVGLGARRMARVKLLAKLRLEVERSPATARAEMSA